MLREILGDFLKGKIPFFTESTYEKLVVLIIISICLLFLYNLLYSNELRESFEPGESAASIAIDSLKVAKMNEGKIELIDERLKNVETKMTKAEIESEKMESQLGDTSPDKIKKDLALNDSLTI